MSVKEEADEIVRLLRESGYDVILDPEFPPPDVPISEAIKDAPKHWP